MSDFEFIEAKTGGHPIKAWTRGQVRALEGEPKQKAPLGFRRRSSLVRYWVGFLGRSLARLPTY